MGREGPWLHAGWKSNESKQEVRVEFIEDLERADTHERLGDLERLESWSMNLVFLGVLGFLLQVMVWYRCPFRELGNGENKHKGPGIIPGSQGVLTLRWFPGGPNVPMMASLVLLTGPAGDVIYSEEIMNSLSLTKRTPTICIRWHV